MQAVILAGGFGTRLSHVVSDVPKPMAPIKNIPFFNISDIEYKFRGNSYTYNTIVKLKSEMKINDKINFIIGTDAFEKIESWYKTDELKKLVHFIIFPRTNLFNKADFDHLKEKGYAFKNIYDLLD